MTAGRTPVTADTASFTFYDIESLSNVFSLVAYTPRPASHPDLLEVFFLVDDEQLCASFDHDALTAAITDGNPGLPAVHVTAHDLRTVEGNLALAQLMGLCDADQVCNTGQKSSYPLDLRPVCDTDNDYNPMHHPYLAGYNSLNYDTTMLALYLSEVFSDVADHRQNLDNARVQEEYARTPEDQAHTQALVKDVLNRKPVFKPVSAATLRGYNDQLFSSEHIDYMPGYNQWDSQAARIRRAMLHSGRHLDIARLNELQHKVALKRLLGMLGRQIKESDKLGHGSVVTTTGELYELLAYNVSDCLGLAQLFEHPVYSSAFDLKAGLLQQYAETVYTKSGTVRMDRLTIDASSAKFVGRILAPYTPLNDIETVSFDYPAKEVADERGIAQVNVLDECVHFFDTQVAPDRATNTEQAAAWAQFMDVVTYYRRIEGENFNDSDQYNKRFKRSAASLKEIAKTPNNIPYFRPDGTASSCFATFSTGGIHGAEADKNAFTRDRIAHVQADTMLHRAKTLIPEAVEFVAEAKRQHAQLSLPDGSYVDKRDVLLGSDPAKVKYRKPKKGDPAQTDQLARAQQQVPDPADLLATQRPEAAALHVSMSDGSVLHGKTVLATTSAAAATYRDEPAKKAPSLFTAKEDESTKLYPKYARTSAGPVIHEDFTSYYPNLLRNMRAFYNPELGEDRYATIFFDKERLGAELKKPGLDAAEKERLTTLRNGTKLILNAASGAGDASHKNPIRMNNRIISMRIIGQLFSWRIGQAQTLAGARLISTNTDGLYSVIDDGSDVSNDFEAETNNRVLEEQKAAIGIDIEPEQMFLISKDSNNRMELTAPAAGTTVAESRIVAASGGTLACHDGPTPTKALAHPAIIDHALARYLQTIAARTEAALCEDFDFDLGRKIIDDARDIEDPIRTALLFQNVIAASRGSITYPFAAAPSDTDAADEQRGGIRDPQPLQMINRAFIVQDGTAGAVNLHNAGAWKVSPVSAAKREKDGLARVENNSTAIGMLRHHGWARDRHSAARDGLNLLPTDQDVVVRRINGIDPAWSMVICNDDLYTAGRPRLRDLIASLDLEVYTQMLAETFTKNWKNSPA
ncbi:hypothetical protein [Arthrobacter castelli]|uniref:hypothetical protein n=1 Tax=Arthrobacter castelli TaxID=271431 RepID=UPI000428157E|nr:hypothetical protein [Arthrobacter castelli]